MVNLLNAILCKVIDNSIRRDRGKSSKRYFWSEFELIAPNCSD